ncbi:MAG: Coq4 family protein [Gammaproteobacteria bacterium]
MPTPPDATVPTRPYAIAPRAALSALRRLLANPEQTELVFEIIRALSGKTILHGYNRFTATPMGRRILDEERNLIERLRDRDWLASLPEGTLGRHYLGFVERENLTADGLVEASETAHGQLVHPGLARYGSRLRDMHDLWHITCGYGRDVSGEACLLAFTVAQTRNPGLALIAFVGGLKIARESGDRRILRALWAAFRTGQRAEWLPAADWEHLLTRPLSEVRSRLCITPPELYQRMRGELAPA